MSRALLLVASLAVAAPAHAQPASEATKLFEQGRELVEQKRFAEACALFERSYALDAQPGTALNLADCAERDGKLREAWRLYDTAAREWENASKLVQAKFARDRAAAVEPRLAIVVVRIADPARRGMVVRIGGREVPAAAEVVERLDAGPIAIEVTAPGAQPFTTTTNGLVGRHTIVDVPALQNAASAVVGDGPADDGSPLHTRRKRSRIYLAAGIGGAGAVTLVVSGVIGLGAASTYNAAFEPEGSCVSDAGRVVCGQEADADAVRRAGSRADVATLVGVAGGAMLVAGVVLFLTAPTETIHVAPTASASGGGISISGTF